MSVMRKQPDLRSRALRAYVRIYKARGWKDDQPEALERMRQVTHIIKAELHWLRDWCRKQAREELLDAVGMQEMDTDELAAYHRSLSRRDGSDGNGDARLLAEYLKRQENGFREGRI